MEENKNKNKNPRQRFRPRLRTLLLSVNLLILLLPLATILLLRLYDSELIRRTEAELIAQGAFVRGVYLRSLRTQPGLLPETQGRPADPKYLPKGEGGFSLIPVEIELAQSVIESPAPAPQDATQPLDPHAQRAGVELTPLLKEVQLTNLAGIRVLDHNGAVVATTGKLDEIGKSYSHFGEVQEAMRGAVSKKLRARDNKTHPLDSMSRGNVLRLWIAIPITLGERVVGVVLLNRTPVSLRKALYEQKNALLIVASAILGVVLLFSILTSLNITRPLRDLIRQTDRVARGERHATIHFDKPGTQEVATLARSISIMAETLELRAKYIKDFAAHVSHEFKTPLASIRGAVELLQDHLDDMSLEERERFLSNLAQDADRLDRLVRRLLELARADTLEVGHDQTQPRPILERLCDRARGQGHPVTLSLTGAPEYLSMAPVTFESIVTILLDNAHTHGGEGVPISTSLTYVGDRVQLIVEDAGAGISTGNAARIFDPFFTSARHEGSSGLGLSILRSLVQAHGGTVVCERPEVGCRFRVELPHGQRGQKG